MSKLILVANRLPVKVQEKENKFDYTASDGGLATGLASLEEPANKKWVGWPGIVKHKKEKQNQIRQDLGEHGMVPVFLTENEVKNYYEGFSNETIWPLFHYFVENTKYSREFWKAYHQVNKRFAREVLDLYEPGDTIWIHDYHLLLLPQMLRQALPEALIGFFLHIPFPSYEVYRQLPWREELLNGLLGANLVGFHTSGYMRHFSSSVHRVLGIEQSLGRFLIGEQRLVQADAFPMGIDYEKFNQGVKDQEVRVEADTYRTKFGSTTLMLSIDRLDYSKGILQRLKAFELFLKRNPEMEGKISLVLVVVPSREHVEEYQHLKEEIDEKVGNINGQYGDLGWLPIHYFYRSLPFQSLLALYSISDIALVTPFRDGMNLIAKEYIASKSDKNGVLILSEMAGVAAELTEALIINPNDLEQMVGAVEKACRMPAKEQQKRIRTMQEKLKRYDVSLWAFDFMQKLREAQNIQSNVFRKYVDRSTQDDLLQRYQQSNKRLIMMDFDGTLMPKAQPDQKNVPDDELLTLLGRLSQDPKNRIVITSSRDRNTLEHWFGHLPVDVVGEHGAWVRKNEKRWVISDQQNQDWKNKVYEMLNDYTIKTPGSYVEERESSLVWHYWQSDAWLADIRVRNLKDAISNQIASQDLQVMKGSKSLEIKKSGISKGKALEHWLAEEDWDFILAIGDDYTDEDTFRTMPPHAYTIKVGFNEVSSAGYNVKYPYEVRRLLEKFLKNEADEPAKAN